MIKPTGTVHFIEFFFLRLSKLNKYYNKYIRKKSITIYIHYSIILCQDNFFVKMNLIHVISSIPKLLVLLQTIHVTNQLSKYTVYNTTSGQYVAELVELDGYELPDKKSKMFVHKLISVPYAEKPERFEQSKMKRFQPGIHGPRELISCYQSVNLSSYGSFTLLVPPIMTEDCLTINLYIPINPLGNQNDQNYKNMSVVVHIHGGSNMVGGAGLFDGSILAAHGGIVVAIINYRLSILGFLSDMTERYPGNYGLRDQLLAIKLVF